MKAQDLIPDEKNFNLGNEYGESLIEKSFAKFGAGRSILIDKNNKVIAGNKSLQKYVESGGEEIEIVETKGDKLVVVKRMDVDLETKRGRELALADNAAAKQNITWNEEFLVDEFQVEELREWGVEIEENLQAQEDDYKLPDEIKTDIVLGDLFQIGNHRLLCGDSTDAEQVARLMGGEKADMVLTDPPYGIGFKYNKHIDEKGDIYEKFCDDWFNALPNCNIKIIFPGWSYNKFWFNKSPYDVFYWIVKNKHSGGKNSHFRNTEPILLWGRLNKKYNFDYILQDSIKKIVGPGEEHTCPKPIELLSELISHSIKNNEIVVDVFGGSGTTMVAAYQINRICRMMEIDPKYCQVIIDRMLKLDPTLRVTKNGQEYIQNNEITTNA